MSQEERMYDPLDTTMTFVDRGDDLDPLCKINSQWKRKWNVLSRPCLHCYFCVVHVREWRGLCQPQSRDVLWPRCHSWQSEAMVSQPAGGGTAKTLWVWMHHIGDCNTADPALCCFKGRFIFRCPAVKEDGTELCNEPWSYREVRRMADLSVEEMQEFEEKIAHLAAAQYCEIQSVSGFKHWRHQFRRLGNDSVVFVI